MSKIKSKSNIQSHLDLNHNVSMESIDSIGLTDDVIKSINDKARKLNNNIRRKKKRVSSRYGRPINLPSIN